MRTFFTIIMVISSLAIIISVLMQDAKTEGLAAISAETNLGGSGNTTTKDQLINRVVVVGAVLFMISAIGLAVI
ncbi:MAG: preprotein translocase subunit SecG [Tissierellia bacterium]|nr:preprotein translocase subunit SecG [Tissierellia bacterium]